MNADEIRARVAELREELFNLRFRNTMKQLDNPLKIRESRREMARLLTVLKEKERAAAKLSAARPGDDMTTETTQSAIAGRRASARWSATAWTRPWSCPSSAWSSTTTYGRYVRRRTKFKVHDEKNECRIGDTIRFMETRPISKDKRWRFVEFVERAK